jgi:hypothetical protein
MSRTDAARLLLMLAISRQMPKISLFRSFIVQVSFSKIAKSMLAAVGLCGLLGAGAASAAGITPSVNSGKTYNFLGAGGGGGALGDLSQGIQLSYNPALSSLRITTAFKNNAVDGYWLAISPGGNPKGVGNELAILYMDLKANKYAVYNYNGFNGNNSYAVGGSSPVSFLKGGDAGMTKAGNTYTFNLNVDGINNSPLSKNGNWSGMEFEDKLGLWYHFFSGDVRFNPDGSLQRLSIVNSGWNDYVNLSTAVKCNNAATGGSASNNCCPAGTTPATPATNAPGQATTCKTATGSSSSGANVPVPGGLLLLGIGLLALGLRLRVSQKSAW